MSDRYKGAILSPTAPTVTPQSAGGIYTSSQQLQYQGQGVWPQAVNNPLTNSLRFRSSASAYLNRTPASTTNQRTFTWSGWVKRGTLGGSNAQYIFSARSANSDSGWFSFYFNLTDTLNVGGWSVDYRATTQLFRDPSAWYHLVLSVDTTQATASNRVRVYVNGSEVTAFSTTNNPTQNFDYPVNSNSAAHSHGSVIGYSSTFNFDGYLAEVNFVDGTQLTPSSFGTTDAYGIWQPIPYTGAYGTNGFYLPFTDNSALTTSSNVGLGKDFSGNGNYWVTNNISITAGSTYDSMKDVPTNTNSNTANYATINPLDYNSTYLTLDNGNLHQTYAGVVAAAASRATMVIPTTGKFYWEVYINATGGGSGERIRAGITRPTTAISGNSIDGSATSYLQMSNGQKRNNSTDSTYGSGFSAGQYIQVLYDATAGAIYFGQNGSYANGTGSFNQAFSGAVAAFTSLSGEFMPCFITYGGADIAVNFGQQPFTYTPPSGFYPLNTYNLPTPTILDGDQYFNAVLWTGNGSNPRSITGVGFQPDMVWAKARSQGYSHGLYDAVRGAGGNKRLYPNETYPENGIVGAEGTAFGSLTSFDSDGFSVNAGTTSNIWFNANNETYVAWNWKANGSGSSNTQGTITSTVSANTTAGFSIVTYTGVGGSGTTTVGHGLGVAPSMVIIKRRNSTADWATYHTGLTSTSYYLFLNSTAGQANYGSTFISPSSSTLTIDAGSSLLNTSTGTYVAYCFSAVAGYSAFGSYTGNGSTDGPFIFTGFRPRFLMIKRTSGTPANWYMWDSSRSPFNAAVAELYPNLSNAEANGSNDFDFLSNGFKTRNTADAGINGSGETFIYMAFAENPFKIARGR